VTEPQLAQLDVEELLVELLDRVRELLDVDTAAVLLMEPSSQELVVTAVRGLNKSDLQTFRVRVGEGFAGRIAAEQKPLTVDKVDRTTVRNPVLWERGVRSLLGVPMIAQGVLVGVLHVGALRPRKFTDEDVNLLRLVADRAALATQTLLSNVDRAAAVALQRSLLPSKLPDVDGVDIAARYVAGSGGVGGDWYDVFVLPSGHLCLVVGDVMGRGLQAAIIMGRLRSALRSYALETSEPADILARLDVKTQHFEPDWMATLVCAIVEPATGLMHVSSAGHPPPVLALPDERAVVLELEADLPIGVGLDEKRRSADIQLQPGTVVCCYTDGLVERRDTPLDDRLELLCSAVRTKRADDVCEAVLAELVGTTRTHDDIALLTVRWTGTATVPT